MPAPLILFCFNRPKHLQQTLDSLAENELASETLLYCFSDGPRESVESDQPLVDKVRSILSSEKRFLKVIIRAREKNIGLSNSVISGVSEILEKHFNAIIIEDDLIFSRDYLHFMNQALDTYEKEMKVSSVSGYSFLLHKILGQNLAVPVKRTSSWGWATWYDRWRGVDWDVKDFESFISDRDAIEEFVNAGKDMLPMLIKQQKGIINSWAIRWTYHHFKTGTFCLVPSFSKVNNTGTDGSGTNFTNKQNKYQTPVFEGNVKFPSEIYQNQEVNDFIREFYNPSFIRRIINYWRFNIWI